MAERIVFIPADNMGAKLILKELRIEAPDVYVQYRSTYNDIPFTEIQIYPVGDNFVITGDDGTILYTFSKEWLSYL